MKKALCTILALLLVLCTFSSFAEESIFDSITGIAPDTTVLTIGENEISAELYFYWFCYVSSYVEYNLLSDYRTYGLHSKCINPDHASVNWNSDMNGMPITEYVKAQTVDTIKYYMAVEELAKEAGAALSESDLAAMQADYDASVASMGGEEEFERFLAALGISRENFDRINSATYLYNDLLTLVTTEGSPLYLDEEGYNKSAVFADHILLASEDMTTGEPLTPEKFMEKYLLAKDLLEQIDASEDKGSAFKALADQYSDDPLRKTNPDGFIYTAGTMIPEFESAAARLKPGEISGIVQSDYGIHIIMRKELLPALDKNPEQKQVIEKAFLDSKLTNKRADTKVVYDPCLNAVDFTVFYETYIAKAQSLNG